MIIYDRTLTAIASLVDEARLNLKAKLRFTNPDQQDEQSPSDPAFPKFPPDLLFQLVSLIEGPPSHGATSLATASTLRLPCAEIAYGGDPNSGRGDTKQPGPWACTQGTSVWLFTRWADSNVSIERRAAVLAHELVHVLCGNELDSEITENVMFPKGSTITPDDIYSIRSQHWRGRWFRVVKPTPSSIDIRYGWNSSIDSAIVADLVTRLISQGLDVTKMNAPVEK